MLSGLWPMDFPFRKNARCGFRWWRPRRLRNRNNTDTWFAFGRLAKGVTFESARAEVETIIKRLEIAYPLTDQRWHLSVQNFHQFFIGPDATVLYGSMWGAVGFVLLIACANLANLMLARAMGRSREISVRIALGAGRWRIIRQLLIESVMLSGRAVLLGWFIAKWNVHAYPLAMAYKASWLIIDYSMDQRVLGYLIAISIATGLLFGLAPAIGLSKLDINTTLKDGRRGSISAKRRGRARQASGGAPGNRRNGPGRRAAGGRGGDDPKLSQGSHRGSGCQNSKSSHGGDIVAGCRICRCGGADFFLRSCQGAFGSDPGRGVHSDRQLFADARIAAHSLPAGWRATCG